jgi:hypothetical protein
MSLVFLLGGTNAVSAIGISPIMYDDIIVDPGQSITKKISITNDTMVPDTYYIYAKNFVPEGEEGHQLYKDEKIGLADWIVPEVDKITLNSWEEKKISYTINVPANAEPGGHYASLFISKIPKDAMDNSSNVGLGSEVGQLLLVQVNGETIEKSMIKEFGVVKEKSHGNRLPTVFFSRIENQGNTHFKPQGTIEIKSMFGSKSTIPANPVGGNVLPQSIRRLESTWVKNASADKQGGFLTELNNEWKNFAIGRYTATLNMLWNVNQPPLTAKVHFWVFPWRVILVALLLLLIFVLIMKGYNKLVVKANKKDQKE